MKVLLVRGNPRKTGYTQRLIDLFLQGLRETPAVLTDKLVGRPNQVAKG